MAISFIGRSQAYNAGALVSLTISTPAGIAVGDKMLVWLVSYNSGGLGTGPTGWTQIGTWHNNTNPNYISLWYKDYATADGTSYSFGQLHLNITKGVMRVYRGVASGAGGIDANAFAVNAGVTSLAIPALSATTTANEWYAALWYWNNGSAPYTSTPADLATNATTDTTGWDSFEGDKVIASSGTTPGSESCTVTTAGNPVAWAVTLKPAASGTTFNQSVTGTAAGAGSFVRQPGKIVSASASGATVTLLKSVGKSLSATASGASVTLKKSVNKLVSATAAAAATLTAKIVHALTVAASAAGVATMSRRAGKGLSATASGASVTLTKSVHKLLSAAAAAVATISTGGIAHLLTLTANAAGVASVTKRIAKAVNAAAAASASIGKGIGKGLGITSGTVASFPRSVGKLITGVSQAIAESVGMPHDQVVSAFSAVRAVLVAVGLVRGGCGPLVDRVLQRVFDPAGVGISRAQVRDLLSRVQQFVCAQNESVLVNTPLAVQPSLQVYTFADVAPDILKIVAVRDGTRDLSAIDFSRLKHIDNHWFGRSGPRLESFAVVGRQLLVVHPMRPSGDTANVVYVRQLPRLNLDSDPVLLPDDQIPLLVHLTEALVLLKQRDISELQAVLQGIAPKTAA